jgi:hypothetical protein
MSTFSILPKGEGFQAVEADGNDRTSMVALFETKSEAYQWVMDRTDDLIKAEQTQIRRVTMPSLLGQTLAWLESKRVS